MLCLWCLGGRYVSLEGCGPETTRWERERGEEEGTSAGTTQPREVQVGMWEICEAPALHLQTPGNLEHVYIVHFDKLSWIHCIIVVVDA